jgi:O-antigen ligase
VKYFPDLGRFYNRWTGQLTYVGVTTNKNHLGVALLVSSLVLLWDYLELRGSTAARIPWPDIAARLSITLMIIWLMVGANSVTPLFCLLVASAIILLLHSHTSYVTNVARHLGAYGIAAIVLVIATLYFTPGVFEGLTGSVGRNTTLTGRNDLWADLLHESTDPVLGTGYQSFWLGATAKRMWDKYYFHPRQAHNGYLETYLNGGLIGVGLLIAMLGSIAAKLKRRLVIGGPYNIVRLAFFVVAVIYSWTEAAFNLQTLVWVITLIAALDSHPPSQPAQLSAAG